MWIINDPFRFVGQLAINTVGVDAYIDPRADVGIRPYNHIPTHRQTEIQSNRCAKAIGNS